MTCATTLGGVCFQLYMESVQFILTIFMLLLLFLREMLHNMLILFIRLVEMIKIKELIDRQIHHVCSICRGRRRGRGRYGQPVSYIYTRNYA